MDMDNSNTADTLKGIEMDKKWTPEPWTVEGRHIVAKDKKGNLRRTDSIAVCEPYSGKYRELGTPEAVANAARIGACVNFLANHPDLTQCEVVSKEKLEKWKAQIDANTEMIESMPKLFEANVTELRSQRDELSHALRVAKPFLMNYNGEKYIGEIAPILIQVEAALAKVDKP